MKAKYFLDTVCGWGNSCEAYIKIRIPEIINEFSSEADAIKYICENEIYIFSYNHKYNLINSINFLKYKYNATHVHGYYIKWTGNYKNTAEYFQAIINKLIEVNFPHIENNIPKFDYIIQTPVFYGKLQTSFLDESLSLLSDTGKMIINTSAKWLINLRLTGDAKTHYAPLKKKLNGHVKSVKIENLHNELNIITYSLVATIFIDFENIYNEFDFYNCGEHKKVNTIFDCNFIGNYNIVQSILNKCISYNDMMINHITNKEIDDNKYLRFTKVITVNGYNSEVDYIKTINGTFYGMYITPCLHKDDNEIKSKILLNKRKKPIDCVYGSQAELENWKYFVLNNKLPLFINMCLIISKNNESLKYVPWLVDKRRTDKEIYDLLGLTLKEIELIENTINKFERSSNWFKRKCEGKNWKRYCKNFE